MTRDDALALLGISAARIMADGGITARAIKTYFGRRAKEVHPDTGARRGVTIAELQQARDLLLNAIKSQNSACALCGGKGKVRGVMGVRRCAACRGKGETR